MTFDVLGTMRAIRNDKELSSTEALLLMCAVLRTDNKTRKVRYSLEGLADDAKVNRKTATRVFQGEEVLKYFSKVVRNKRVVDLWFTDVSQWDTESHSESEGLSVQESERDIESHSVGHSVQREGHSVPPSTSSSTSIYQEASAIAPASTLQEDEHKEEAVTESVETSSLPSENPGSYLEKRLAEKRAQKERLAAFLAEENEMTQEQQDRSCFTKDELEHYWDCIKKKHETHLEAMASVERYRLVDAEW
jgi:hypothetical protein